MDATMAFTARSHSVAGLLLMIPMIPGINQWPFGGGNFPLWTIMVAILSTKCKLSSENLRPNNKFAQTGD
jgi:hypothetical protein